MKKIKILFVTIFIATLTSCSSNVEDNEEKKLNAKTVNESSEVVDFGLLAEETQARLNVLLSAEGYQGIDDESLEIGNIDENQRFQINNFQNQILSLHAKILGLEHNFIADFTNFVYVSADENNGYPMLISSGKCNISNENITIAVDIIVNQNSSAKVRNLAALSKLSCSGCIAGCSPRRASNGDGYCTACDAWTSHVCTKTESI
jgi:hypothetical protein